MRGNEIWLDMTSLPYSSGFTRNERKVSLRYSQYRNARRRQSIPFTRPFTAGGRVRGGARALAQIALSAGGGFDSFATILSVLRP